MEKRTSKVIRLFFYLGLCLASLCGRLWAQSSAQLDSLERSLPQLPDTVKVKTLSDLCFAYRQQDTAKAFTFGKQALALAQKIGYAKGEAQAWNDLGILHFGFSHYPQALEAYTKALAIRKRLNDEVGMAALYNKMGLIKQEQGHYDQALADQLQALKVFEKKKLGRETALVLNTVANIYNRMGKYAESIQTMERVLALAKELNNPLLQARALTSLANVYQTRYMNARISEGYPEMPLAYYKQAIALLRPLGDKDGLAGTLNSLSGLLGNLGQVKEAIPYVEEAIALRQEMGDIRWLTAALLNKAYFQEQLGQKAAAEATIRQALELAKQIQALPSLQEGYFALSRLQQGQGRYKEALESFRLFEQYKDSIYNQETAKKLDELQTIYQTAQKEDSIRKLHDESRIKSLELGKSQAELSQRNLLIVGLLLILVAASVIGWQAYNRRQIRARAELAEQLRLQQEIRARAVLEAEEAERNRIGRELHDGIGQMLSAARLNLDSLQHDLAFTQDEERFRYRNAIELVDESCAEVRSISHAMLPNALIRHGLGQAVKEFLGKIAAGDRLKVHVETIGLEEKLDSTLEAVLYRVVQECVNNVIKHAQASQLNLHLVRHEQEISLLVEDNGRGFDPKLLSEGAGGIGLKNIETRIAYLGGTVHWDSAPGRGTSVSIEVPLPQAAP